MRRILLSFSLLTALGGTVHADWHNFRGPGGTAVATGCDGLPTNLSGESIAWKTSLPGRGLGSPIVVGDRVFLTAASGPDQRQLHVFCFDAADGKKVWERRFWATGRTMCHRKTCVAAPTPASDGKLIFALFSSNDLIALDLEGNVRWLRGLTLDYPNASNSLGLSSSPIVSDKTLILQIENDSESFAAGLDVANGKNRWKIDRPKAANWTSPVLVDVEGTEVALLQSSKGVQGVVPRTGSRLFDYRSGAATIPSAVTTRDTLYLPSQGLTALRLSQDGSGPEKLWNEGAQRPGTASPILIGERVYTINGAGVLTCADAATGERKWRLRLKGPFSSSPVAADAGFLYIFNEKGLGQCVDLNGEEGRVVSEFSLEETILATAALSDDALFIRSDGTLWKFAVGSR